MPKPEASPSFIVPKIPSPNLVHLWGSLKDHFKISTYFGPSILQQKAPI